MILIGALEKLYSELFWNISRLTETEKEVKHTLNKGSGKSKVTEVKHQEAQR